MRLGKILKTMRAMEDIGVREQAKKIGISFPTLSRIENGKDADARSVVKLLVYLLANDEQAA